MIEPIPFKQAVWVETGFKAFRSGKYLQTTKNITFEGTELTSSSQISEAFNKHFTTVGPKLAGKTESQPSDDPLSILKIKP